MRVDPFSRKGLLSFLERRGRGRRDAMSGGAGIKRPSRRGPDRLRHPNEIGPGVYDIHSPRVPDAKEMAGHPREALGVITPHQLWVNPDCGLKTGRFEEVVPSLRNMVAAARQLREETGLRASRIARNWASAPRRSGRAQPSPANASARGPSGSPHEAAAAAALTRQIWPAALVERVSRSWRRQTRTPRSPVSYTRSGA